MKVINDGICPWSELFSERALRIKSSAIRELLKVTEQEGFISFAGGFPAPELFPVPEVSETITRVLKDQGEQALQYSATEGYRPLREWAAGKLQDMGVRATVDNVLITTGSQQALDLLGKILIDEKDKVAVESPTYLAALQAWRVYGADFQEVPLDEDGMCTDYLRTGFTTPPKVLYTIPTFQNPTGATMPLERRKDLISWTQSHGVCVVEDDPYGELRFEGKAPPRLIQLEAQSREDSIYSGSVIYLSTFSKVLAPGLRVGAVVAHPQVITKLVQAKQASDLHTPTLNQMVCYELAKIDFLKTQAERVAGVYKERRDVLMEEVFRLFPSGTKVVRPEGGMFLWVTLPQGYNAQVLWEKALTHKVAFVPGAPFYPNKAETHTLRLNFSNSNEEQIREGMRRLSLAFQ